MREDLRLDLRDGPALAQLRKDTGDTSTPVVSYLGTALHIVDSLLIPATIGHFRNDGNGTFSSILAGTLESVRCY